MAQRSYYQNGQGDPVAWFRGKVRKIESGTDDALEQAVEDGKNIMKDLISTRGTGREWGGDYGSMPNGFPGRTSSTNGRVASGEMRDSVTSSFNRTAAGNASGRFGWLTNRKTYFGLQEGGFEHPNGMTVEGMYAMADASELAWSEFQKQVSKVLKNA